jgi:hypothetical protein
VQNNYLMRRTAVDFGVPLLTNIHLVKLFCEAVARHKKGELIGLQVRSLPAGHAATQCYFREIDIWTSIRVILCSVQASSLFDYYKDEKPEQAWTSPSEFH